MKDKVTLIIKTFERPKCVERLIYSIKMMYPNLRIIVTDDSREARPLIGVEHLRMSYDSGVSAGRNLALNSVDTQFVVTLDDDFVFDHRTNLEKWLEILENNTEIDIIGGQVDGHPPYAASLHIEDNALIFNPSPRSRFRNFDLWDIVLQFWIGKTKKIKAIGGWDDELKTCDHILFFARSLGKLKIAHIPDVIIGHKPINDENYYNHRNLRMQKYLRLLMEKLGINRVIDVHGRTLYTYDGHALQ